MRYTPEQMEQPNRPQIDHVYWNDYFMGLAMLASKRGVCSGIAEGAVFVNDTNKVVCVGHSNMVVTEGANAAGVSNSTNRFAAHAVMHAVANKGQTVLQNCRVFATNFPCTNCAIVLIRLGIKGFYYLRPCDDPVSAPFISEIFESAGIEFQQYIPPQSNISLHF